MTYICSNNFNFGVFIDRIVEARNNGSSEHVENGDANQNP